MVESSPALALVLVQHKSVADDGSALGGNKCRERQVEISKISVHIPNRTISGFSCMGAKERS